MNRGVFKATDLGYQHPEALCLMKYATDDGSEVEWLWNSRDGVTPFCITSHGGKLMSHVEWHLDRFLPEYQPLPGERIFVDVTRDRALPQAREFVERYWEPGEGHPGMKSMFANRDDAVEATLSDWCQPGQPMVIEARDWDGKRAGPPPNPPTVKTRWA